MISGVIALVCLLPAIGLAQNDNAKARTALAPFARLVGKWEGDAKVSIVPGAPAQNARQSYEITSEAGGTVIRVHGTGRGTDQAAKGASFFEANATIWFDAQQNRVRMMARQAQGDSVEASIETRPDTLIWSMPMQAGRLRFTIAYTNTDWHEVGHLLREGAPPFQVLETNLKKKK